MISSRWCAIYRGRRGVNVNCILIFASCCAGFSSGLRWVLEHHFVVLLFQHLV